MLNYYKKRNKLVNYQTNVAEMRPADAWPGPAREKDSHKYEKLLYKNLPYLMSKRPKKVFCHLLSTNNSLTNCFKNFFGLCVSKRHFYIFLNLMKNFLAGSCSMLEFAFISKVEKKNTFFSKLFYNYVDQIENKILYNLF